MIKIDAPKIFISLFLTFNFLTSYAQKNALKFDLFGLTQGEERLTFERAIGESFSFSLAVEHGNYFSKKISSTLDPMYPIHIYNIKGFGVMPEIRYYPFKVKDQSLLGFFIGIYGRQRWTKEGYYKFKTSDDLSSMLKAQPLIKTMGIIYDYGINMGYKIRFSKLSKALVDRFSLESLIGFGMSTTYWQSGTDRASIPFNMTGLGASSISNHLRFQLSVGYLFGGMKKNVPTFQ